MSEPIGSFEMINVVEAKTTDGSSNGELIENTSQYKVVHINKLTRSYRGIWKYFGIAEKENATEEERKHRASDRILCLLCFQKGKVHVYKRSTSSGNLWRHLHKKHAIPVTKGRVIGAAIRVKAAANRNGDFGDKFIMEDDDDDATLFSTEMDISSIAGVQKIEILSTEAAIPAAQEDVGAKKENVEIFKDIGSLLITEISKRPALYEWDSNDVDEKTKFDAEWQEVFEALGQVLDINRLQNMWKNIRNRYKKIRNLERQGINDGVKYKYYDQLAFMDCEELIESPPQEASSDPTCTDSTDLVESFNETFDEPLTKKYKNNDNDNDFNVIIQNNNDDMHIIKTEKTINQQNSDSLSTTETLGEHQHQQREGELQCEIDVDQISRSVQTSPISASATAGSNVQCHGEILDEFDLFGRFIAEKMRRLPRSQIDDIEIKIIGLLKANSGYHN